MSWKIHTNFVVGKLSRMVGILSRIQENLPRSALKTLYFSFFQPSIQYGIVFWFFVSKDIRDKIVRLQKKAIRIITQSSYHAHTDELFKSLKILKFYDLFKLESCKFIHHEINFANNFSLMSHSDYHSYSTRNNSNLSHRLYLTQIGFNFVLCQGITLYNHLDENLKTLDTMYKFKCKLKLDLISLYGS